MIKITGNKDSISDPEVKLQIAEFVLKNTEVTVKEEEKKVFVSKQFLPFKTCDKFKEHIKRKGAKEVKSQNFTDDEYQIYNEKITKKDFKESFLKKTGSY